MEQQRLRRHRSSLEGVIVPSSQPLNADERDLAIRIFDEIILHFESSQATDSGYKPVTLISLMKNEVSEKDEFLNLFFSLSRKTCLTTAREGSVLTKFYHTLLVFPTGQLIKKLP
jgi:hypothetical protein